MSYAGTMPAVVAAIEAHHDADIEAAKLRRRILALLDSQNGAELNVEAIAKLLGARSALVQRAIDNLAVRGRLTVRRRRWFEAGVRCAEWVYRRRD